MDQGKKTSKRRPDRDSEILSLFLVLGLLTVLFVFGVKWVLIGTDKGPQAPIEAAIK